MIISYQSHKNFKIHGDGLKIIGSKSPIAYRDIIQSFQDQNSLITCSDDNYSQLDITKEFDFVGDPLLTKNVTEKYIHELVNNYIVNLDEENRNRIIAIFHKLESLLQDSLFLEDVPLEINFEEDLKKLLKIEGIHLDFKLMQNPYAIIETILKIHEICNLHSVPVICNVANYLDKKELEELSKIAYQINLTVILIEFTDFKNTVFPEDAEFYYIDQDLIDWY